MTNSNNDIKIVRTQVSVKPRKLTGTWTFENKMADAAANSIRDEIDWDILCEIDHNRRYWVEIPFSESAKQAGKSEIKAWVKQTFGKGFFVFEDRIMFDREQDAEFFMLKWS